MPIPACAPIDNEAGLLEREELGESVVAEGVFETADWVVIELV